MTRKTFHAAFAILLLVLPPGLHAALPEHLITRAVLRLSSNGATVPDSTSNSVTFRIYSVASGGAPLWAETWSPASTSGVTTTSGLFNVVIGSFNPVALPFDQPYWLEIVCDNGGVPEAMAPRQPLTTAPYAFRAKNIDAPLSLTLNASNAAPLFVNNTSNGDAIDVLATAGVGMNVNATGNTGVLSYSNTSYGVQGQTGVNSLAGIYGLNNSATTGSGVLGLGVGGTGVVGQGVTGVAGTPNGANGVGVLAGDGGFAGALALRVKGGALFTPGSVTFAAHVDFSGATVTGLPGTSAPLSLTLNSGANAPLSVSNATGTALLVQGGLFGVSVVADVIGGTAVAAIATDGNAIYARNLGGGGFKPTIYSETSNTNHAIEGKNLTTGAVGILGGEPFNNNTGAFGQSLQDSSSKGVFGVSTGFGVYGTGLTGVAGVVTATGQTALLGNAGGQLGALALHTMGDALIQGGSVTFTPGTNVYFNGANVFGLAPSVPNPLSLSNSLGGPVIYGMNTGAGAAIAANGGALGLSVTAAASGGSPVAGSFSSNGSLIGTNAYGLMAAGSSSAASGVGIKATAAGPSSGTIGVWGEAPNHMGVLGSDFSAFPPLPGTSSIGVYGYDNVAGGIGIYGRSESSMGGLIEGAGMGLSVTARSPVATGIYSEVNGSGAGLSWAIMGVHNGSGGGGAIIGLSNQHPGITGMSDNYMGVQGVGVTGVAGVVTRTGATGVLADSSGFASGIALRTVGNNRIDGVGNTTTFQSGHTVNFTGAYVVGLSGAVTAPLSLTNNTTMDTVFSENIGSGMALHGKSNITGQGAVLGENTNSNGAGVAGVNSVAGPGGGVGVFAQSLGDNGQAVNAVHNPPLGNGAGSAIYATNTASNGYAISAESLNIGVSATSSSNTGIAILGRVNSSKYAVQGINDSVAAGSAAVYGQTIPGGTAISGSVGAGPTNGVAVRGDTGDFGIGVYGSSASGIGVQAKGATVGVSATATGASGQAIYGRVNSTQPAVEIINDAAGGIPLKINGMKFPANDGATAGNVLKTDGLGNLSFAPPALPAAPVTISGAVTVPGAVLSVTNTGTGYGIIGAASAPGFSPSSQVDNTHMLTAGVYGFTSSTLSAGVIGMNTNSISNQLAGVVGISYFTGIYGSAYGLTNSAQGGSFDGGPMGTGVSARGVTGVAAQASANGAAISASQSSGYAALVTSGNSFFGPSGGGSKTIFQQDVTFSSGTNVYFNGANVNGLPAVGVPLNLTNTGAGNVIFADSTGTGVFGGTGLYGRAAWTLPAVVADGNGIGLSATANSGTGYGVVASNSATSGNPVGVLGNAYGITNAGAGVQGQAYNGAAPAFSFASGVYGYTTYTSGVGVVGDFGGTSASGWGVYGTTGSTNGIAVYGYESGFSGTVYGVKGENNSNGAGSAGVFGIDTNAFGVSAQGMTATSAAGNLVGLLASASAATGQAVVATVNSSNPAVQITNNGTGTPLKINGMTFPTSDGGFNGKVLTTNGLGTLSFQSATVSAPLSLSGSGVIPISGTDILNSTAGVAGVGKFGVQGTSAAGAGTPPIGAGVLGLNNNASAVGVYGLNPLGTAIVADGNSVGLSATANSTTGIAVYARSKNSAVGSGTVFAQNDTIGGQVSAIYGLTSSGIGVVGSNSGAPVLPATSAGVAGYNSSGYGVWGKSAAAAGVNPGVWGENTAGGTAIGVLGTDTVGPGAPPSTAGVYGYSSTNAGSGVYGKNAAAAGTPSGVFGSISFVGTPVGGAGGVKAQNTGTSGIANPATALDIDGGISFNNTRTDKVAGQTTALTTGSSVSNGQVSTLSVIILTPSGASGPGSWYVTAGTGSFVINHTFAAATAFNYIILNPR